MELVAERRAPQVPRNASPIVARLFRHRRLLHHLAHGLLQLLLRLLTEQTRWLWLYHLRLLRLHLRTRQRHARIDWRRRIRVGVLRTPKHIAE